MNAVIVFSPRQLQECLYYYTNIVMTFKLPAFSAEGPFCPNLHDPSTTNSVIWRRNKMPFQQSETICQRL